jgi:hypothetical protein
VQASEQRILRARRAATASRTASIASHRPESGMVDRPDRRFAGHRVEVGEGIAVSLRAP